MEPVHVIYIAGYGRCGSTLMENVLAGLPGMTALGEVKYLWDRGCRQNLLCGCGQPFWQCDFWPGVVNDALRKQGIHPSWEEILAWQRASDAILMTPLRLWPALDRRIGGQQCTRFTELLGQLYAALHTASGRSILVDSSKFPSYGLLLTRLPNVKLHVIHLVRDSRAVAYSWTRKKQRPEVHWETAYMPRYPAVRTAAAWYLHNRLAHALKHRAANYRLLRYEAFVENPGDVLQEVLEEFGFQSDPRRLELERLQADRTTSPVRRHSVSGNPDRFRQSSTPIQLDAVWRRDLPLAARCSVFLLTWPLLRSYGYRW